MNSKKLLYTGLILLLIIVAATGLFIYYQSRPKPTTTPVSTPVVTAPQTTPTVTENQVAPQTTHPVSVFFSKHPQSDDDPSATFAVNRTSPDAGVGKFAISELLKGPTSAESSAAYFTTARLRTADSNCGGPDFTLKVSEGVATLKFCRPFDHLGVVADGQAESEIKATLMQFSNVQRVIILNSSDNCEFDLSGLELCKDHH